MYQPPNQPGQGNWQEQPPSYPPITYQPQTPPPGYQPSFQSPPYQQQQPSFTQPPMPPKPKKSRTWLWIITIFVVAIISYSAGTAGSHSTSDTTTTTATTSDTTQASTSATQPAQAQPTQPPATPTPTPKWTTVQSFTGSGIKKTGTFTVGDDWKIQWSCNPASFSGVNQYNVQVYVYASDNSMQDVAVNELCQQGNTSGETEEHQGGDVYLSINSEADWSITIQELK